MAAAARDTGLLTQVGMTLGTPAYMSPEQSAGDEIDSRSDLFSLGCVLYEMLSGEVAFTGSSAAAIIARRFIHTPPSLTVARADVPEAVAALVMRMLEIEAGSRPATGAEVLSVLRASSGAEAVQARAYAAAPTNSIAVMPFENMSPDAENAFFGDGLTEEILTDLSRVRALRVTSRTSSMQHKDSDKGPRAIGRALGVRFLLSGSVRRAGTAIRISAHLVDTEDDRQVWGEKYSGTLDDVFDLQERVSREIVAALGITLQPDEDRRFAARSFRHAEAYELYLHARGKMQMVSTSDEKWRGLLARAVALEGETPILRGLRVWGEIMLLKAGAGDPSRIGDIEREAHDLVQIAPDAPWGYSALGYAAIEAGNMRSAITWLRQALTRDPTDTDSRYWLVTAYAYGGLLEEAADAAVDMFAIDPLSSSSAIAGIVGTYFMGKRDGVLATVLRVLAAEPNNFGARWMACYVCTSSGDFVAAQRHLDCMLSVAPEAPYVIQADALLRVVRGDRQGGLARVAAVDLTLFDSHLTFHIAEVPAMGGEIERGLDVLAMGVEKGFTPVQFITTHCAFIEPLRGHPRFAVIVADAAGRREAVRRGASSS